MVLVVANVHLPIALETVVELVRPLWGQHLATVRLVGAKVDVRADAKVGESLVRRKIQSGDLRSLASLDFKMY